MEVEVLEKVAQIIWQDSLSMMVEHIGIVEMVKDEWGEHEYIYDAFGYDDTNCSMFFTHYKHLFNVDLDHPKIRITPTLMGRMVDTGMICDKQECQWRLYLHIHFAKNE